MLKIAIDCRMIGSGGIGSFISELIPYLLQENECLLIGSHDQCSPFLSSANAEFIFCETKPFSLKELIAFPPEVSEKINHYQVYFSPYCNIPSGITIPIFTTIHDMVFLDIKELTGFAGRLIRKMFYQRAVNYSNGVFTVSEFSKERILHHLHCKKEIQVVYNAAPKYLQKEFEDGKPERKDQFIFVGNIKKHKGLKSLLEAFQLACQQGLKSKLLIVGNSENFRTGDEETVKKLEELQSSGLNIEFTGRISNDELKYLYASSKALIQPSLYEGFGIPPLEAMTLATRAIISDIQVFKEIYSDMPVTFFEKGNPQSLAEKLLSADGSPLSQEEVSTITKKYSYEESAKKIVEVMTNLK